MLYLVRHAKAGSRHEFIGDDKKRPLSPPGRRQADEVGTRLVKEGVQHFISSPSLRCIQTLRPAAKSVGVKVDTDDRLFEGRPASGVLELLAAVPEGTALCSHGDVIPETMDALVRRGCEIRTVPDWRKATVWVLERSDGEIVSAEVWPPPDAAR